MKKLLTLALVLCLAAIPALADTDAAPDAVTSASVTDYFADGIISGDDLYDALNSYSGFFAIASVNGDGTPNLGFFVYGCVKSGEKYYLQLGLDEGNQTFVNIENGSEIVAMYAAVPSDTPYAISGTRMTLERVTDEALLAELLATAPGEYQPMYYEITSVRPLG